MKRIIFIIITALISSLAFALPVAKASEREYAIKAGFIYNFARYSNGDWFDSELNDVYRICSTDASFVNIAKATLKGQKVKGSPVQVEYISTPRQGCHSLFFASKNKNTSLLLLDEVAFRNTMIIGESKGFIKGGGHINFFNTGGKIRFEIAPKRLRAANITLSSKVMRMGRIIKDTN